MALALQLNRRLFVPQRVTARNRQRVLAVVNHLERHYAEDWTLHSMARLSNLSRFHFLRTFKAVTGQSPRQFLLYARLRAAAQALLLTSLSIGALAAAAGFNDLSHFNATFRRAFGCNPRSYRRIRLPRQSAPTAD